MFVFAKNIKQKVRIFTFLSLCMNQFVHAEVQVQTSSVFVKIKDLFNKALDSGKEEEVIVDKKQKLTLKIEQPSLDTMRYVVMDQMAKQPDVQTKKSTSLDLLFLKKMELFCGEGETKNHLLSLIDSTETVFGYIMLARQLAEPTHDIETLSGRQNVTQEFLTNQQLFNEIQEQLLKIKAAEPYFIAYFQKENAVNEELFKKIYWGDRLGFLNSNPWTLELGVRLGNLGNLFAISALPFTLGYTSAGLIQVKSALNKDPVSYPKAFGLGMMGLVDPRLNVYKNGGLEERKNDVMHSFQELQELSENYNGALNAQDAERVNEMQILMQRQSEKFVSNILNVIPQTCGDAAHIINNIHGTPKYIALGVMGTLAGLQAYMTYNAVQDARLKQDIANHLQTRMIAVASYINALKALGEIVKNNPVLANLPDMQALAALSSPHSTLSRNCKKLLELLDHTTFAGDASVFSLTGRVLAAHRLMQKVKEELVPACAAAGRIDAYLSVAKLYQKFQDTPAKFCFVDFKKAEKPMVYAVKFWNPFINAYEVVTNSIELGVNNPNNIILTGPNTGGKSTVTKGLEICIFLAQTVGIAPAEELLFTPFANLNCYLNITDDLTAGTSLFKAEVLRAKALINAVRSLALSEFSFTIIDEVFSGTSPKEGEEAALKFAQELGVMEKSLCTIATHFPRLTEELSADYFKNYKVTVYKGSNGKWVRPFTLEEGKSLLNIAMDLLKEEGIFSN
jgi:hypothetical protein